MSWTDTSDDDEVSRSFRHPHPLVAELFEYEGEWVLDLAWMDGGYAPDKEHQTERHRRRNMTVEAAMEWATVHIRAIIAT